MGTIHSPPAGRQVTLREVVKGKTWIERPAVVVGASDEEFVIACVAGSEMRFPVGLDDRRAFLRMWDRGDWELGTRVFRPPTTYRIMGFGRDFDVWFTLGESGRAQGWYVNLQAPIEVLDDFIITTDRILDVWVTADLTGVTLKDEDELALAVSSGVFSPDEGDALRRTAEWVTDRVLSGAPPWDVGWAERIAENAARLEWE